MITALFPQSDAWLKELKNAIRDPHQLLKILGLEKHAHLLPQVNPFPCRVPYAFIQRMESGNINDPLLNQVLPLGAEYRPHPNPLFSSDPLQEQSITNQGLLKKYKGRALLLVKGSCAGHCRYCFRRHFPYHDHPGNQHAWQHAIQLLREDASVEEIIFSGGDPLMAKDHELKALINQLETIPHLKRLRIHTRLPVFIPTRLTAELADLLAVTRFHCSMVLHSNHGNEIDAELRDRINHFRTISTTLFLNQSVLLKGINNCVTTLKRLSENLFDAGIIPYYLHWLDPVIGAERFFVPLNEAQSLINQLMVATSGYLVPRLVCEQPGSTSKVPLLPAISLDATELPSN